MSRHTGVTSISNTDWSDDPLERLQQMREAREYLDVKIEETVVEARTTDRWQRTHIDHVPGRTIEQREENEFGIATWDQIAGVLGVSRQATWRKFAHLIP